MPEDEQPKIVDTALIDMIRGIAKYPNTTPREQENLRKMVYMRKCECGHRFAKHSRSDLYLYYKGTDRPQGDESCIGADGSCECKEFIHLKRESPCLCGHDKIYHTESLSPGGQIVLKCKYCGCAVFRLAEEKVASRSISLEEQHRIAVKADQAASDIDYQRFRKQVAGKKHGLSRKRVKQLLKKSNDNLMEDPSIFKKRKR